MRTSKPIEPGKEESKKPRTTIEVGYDTRDELANLAHKRESYDAALKRIMKSHRECRCDWVESRAPDEAGSDKIQFVIIDFRTQRPQESIREFVDRVVKEQLNRVGIEY